MINHRQWPAFLIVWLADAAAGVLRGHTNTVRGGM